MCWQRLRLQKLIGQRTDLQISFHVSTVASIGVSESLCLVVCVFADDFSRVKLDLVEGREETDYINASYIDVSHKFSAPILQFKLHV